MSDLNPARDSLDSATVRELVQRLNGRSPEYSHLYDPLRPEAADAFEQEHRITLPSDYRYVITQIANGVHGVLFPLDKEQMRGVDYTRDYEDLGLIGDISQPFPLTEAWNLPEELLREPEPAADATPEEEQRLYEEWSSEVEAGYVKNSHIRNGARPISTLGCGQVMWLVVNGPQKGYVWNDSIADSAGVFPLCDASGRQMTFTDWFLSELPATTERRRLVRRRRIRRLFGPDALEGLRWLLLFPVFLVAGLVFVCFHPRTTAHWLRERFLDFNARRTKGANKGDGS
jgi:hypothetical protein